MLMKHLVLARLFAIATLGVTLVTSLSVQASADDDVWQVLQKAAVAAHALSYQGIFYYQAGSQSKPVQITHLFNGKGEFARNVVLDNAPREVFSQGNDLVIFNPRNEKIVIEKRHGQNMFPAILPTNLDSVKESYSLRAGERERVAGRPAQMLFLEPKDTLRYGYRFWIDTEYGLLLKSEMLNGHNEVIESIAFNQLGLMDILDLDWFQPKIDNKKNYVMENETATIAYNSVSTDWKLKDLPLGFRKVDQMIRMVHGKTSPVTHVVLSDGLASVSLFIEPITKNIKPRIGHKLVGGTSFFASVSDGYQLTVVGEVPEVTVAQIANAVVFKK
jgi:sigma-E factor negative regulatory protein RseB